MCSDVADGMMRSGMIERRLRIFFEKERENEIMAFFFYIDCVEVG